jgi:hypothetical protein
VSLRLTSVHSYPGPLSVTGDGLPAHTIGSCVPGAKVSRIVAAESQPGTARKLSNGAYAAVLTDDGGNVVYVVPIAGGVLAFGQSGSGVNAALVYLVEHTRGRILQCLSGEAGCSVHKVTVSPNAVAIKPPAGLSGSERATFLAGAVIAGETGCEGCHQIGQNGNNGPGKPLTHIGAVLGPAALASALRNPRAPMPSFAGLAQASPKKFRALVQFLEMLK